MNIIEILGKNLEFKRKEANLSCYALGQLANLSPNTISNIEKNIGFPRYDTLKQIANALQISVEELFNVPKDCVNHSVVDSEAEFEFDLLHREIEALQAENLALREQLAIIKAKNEKGKKVKKANAVRKNRVGAKKTNFAANLQQGGLFRAS